jgi:hypothetical protein
MMMSGTDATLSLGRAAPDRELRDDELDEVTGGLVVNAIIAVLIGLLHTGIDGPVRLTKPGIGPV